MQDLVSQVANQDPKRYEIIGLHLRGKYCTSGLAGDPALYNATEKFADMGDPYYTPPLSIVELYHPVQLLSPFSYTVGKINNAIDYTKSARGGNTNSGIAIKSAINGSNIEFTANIRTNKTNQYRLFAFVVEDKVISPQVVGKNEWDNDYEHNSVGTFMLEGEDPLLGVDIGEIKKGQERSTSLTINMSHFNTKRDVNLNNCRIVAYTLRMINGKYNIDNIVSCPVNGSTGYQYETE